MSLNAHLRSREEAYYLDMPFSIFEDSREHPTVWPSVREVFILDPPERFVAVSTSCPRPDCLEDGVIDRMKDGFTHPIAVIQSPSANERIEFGDQFVNLPKQKAFCVFSGWLKVMRLGERMYLTHDCVDL